MRRPKRRRHHSPGVWMDSSPARMNLGKCMCTSTSYQRQLYKVIRHTPPEDVKLTPLESARMWR